MLALVVEFTASGFIGSTVAFLGFEVFRAEGQLEFITEISLEQFAHIVEAMVGHGYAEPGEAEGLLKFFDDGMDWFVPGFRVADAEVDLALAVVGSEVEMLGWTVGLL
jgi:hypothetical protein